ncbi:MAG: iron-containing alcohol dehydrogenase [Agathobacter sp.]|nr:iron-containing alcohol dehydrogenase [Agathobacter sp.]
MNPLKKAYCRTFQAAFRLAMPFMPYREPEILNSVAEVPSLLKKLGISSVLLVTDKMLRQFGATTNLEKHLEDANIKCVVYDETCPNPTVNNVEAARTLYVNEKCEGLIAFGGGSSMDCAKAVGARIAYPNKTVNQMKGLLKVMRKLPTLIAVPTTAGTGSEVTVTSVITNSEIKHKYTMNSFPLIPAYAVLDPAVTLTLPPSLTATTGMDALTHAVEAYIGGSTTKETRAYALEATKLIFENLETAYADGKNVDARRNMLRAAYVAGIAFSKSYVGYIHAVAHTLGGQYNVPHGLANAVLMPIVLDVYGESAYVKLHQLAKAAGISKETDLVEDSAKRFIQAIRDMNARMNIPTGFTTIVESDIPMMAKHADAEANPLYPVPMLMNAKELEHIYHKAIIKE